MLLRRNPITDDVWIIMSDFVRHKITHAAMGVGLYRLVDRVAQASGGPWTEIERQDLR
jgi:hypothetical protein